ncbi:hypothetical protein [Kitasatospora phosalacinea]|uniref:hypothetical protein n=1 Tax=Kitasatospora phosalacinea TaxID=2065 RepID=UPI00052499C9|nr:hypothetical protein [Kitasatospora phosalacinea]
MVSAQILVGGDGSETVLEEDALQHVDPCARTDIPLVVVQEARTDGGHHVEIVLTDGAVHRVDGGNPTAAAAFLTALTAALPERRDPAGSARVTVAPQAPAAELEKTKRKPLDRPRAIALAVLLAYVGNTIGVGVVCGALAIVLPLVAVIPLILGASLQFNAVHLTRAHLALRRRGITVPAHFKSRGKDGAFWYAYTSADGAQHLARGNNLGPVTRVVYDPADPGEHSFELSAKSTALTSGFLTLFGLPLLVGGVALTVLPFFLD